MAIDGGGSWTRCVAFDEPGNILGEGSAGASNHLLVEKEIVKKSFIDVICAALEHSSLQKKDISCLSAGLAGVDFDGSGADDIEDIFREIGFENTLINGDMVIAHAGALAGESGILALAGTGSSILGIGTDGERVKVGGWGPVYGDEGSAYFIGQAALRAAARDFDGRGNKTILTKAMLEQLGLNSFSETPDLVYTRSLPPREIASLSRLVNDVAEDGDGIALEILTQAGRDLAEGVASTLRRLKMNDENVLVSYQGSVLKKCSFVRKSFAEELARFEPTAEVIPPKYEPVIGAYLLGRKTLGLEHNERVFNSLAEQIKGKSDGD